MPPIDLGKSLTVNGSISDLKQVLVQDTTMMSKYKQNAGIISVLPKNQLQLVQQKKNMTLSTEISKSEVDLFNINMHDGNVSPNNAKLRPIVKGGKLENIKSVGYLKNMIRARGYRHLKHELTKLPPPPLGKTIGHGIIQN